MILFSINKISPFTGDKTKREGKRVKRERWRLYGQKIVFVLLCAKKQYTKKHGHVQNFQKGGVIKNSFKVWIFSKKWKMVLQPLFYFGLHRIFIFCKKMKYYLCMHWILYLFKFQVLCEGLLYIEYQTLRKARPLCVQIILDPMWGVGSMGSRKPPRH